MVSVQCMKRNQNFKFSCQTFLDGLNRKTTTLISKLMHFLCCLGKLLRRNQSQTNITWVPTHLKNEFLGLESPGEKEDMKMSLKNPGNFCKIHYSHLMANHAFGTIYIHVPSQKMQGFCVANFATLSDERRSHSKIFLLLNMDKRTLHLKI